MKLTTKGRYAVMAMADLALHVNERPVCLSDIAERQGISLSYLEQLFGKLRRNNLVKSVRGPGGGYRPGRSPDDISIAEIVLAVDEPLRATRCQIGSPKGCIKATERCLTHDLWESLGNSIHNFLGEVTLGDVVQKRVRPTQVRVETATVTLSGGSHPAPDRFAAEPSRD